MRVQAGQPASGVFIAWWIVEGQENGAIRVGRGHSRIAVSAASTDHAQANSSDLVRPDSRGGSGPPSLTLSLAWFKRGQVRTADLLSIFTVRE